MIKDHRYDAGWPRDDSQGCIVQVGSMEAFIAGQCGQPETEHRLSEYPSQRPDREWSDAGSMHEPPPYTGELDWANDGSELLHPFID